MWKQFKAHFTKAELISVIQSFVGFAAVDAVLQFNTILGGNWSEQALFALMAALGRSLFKAIWNQIQKPVTLTTEVTKTETVTVTGQPEVKTVSEKMTPPESP